MTLATCGLRGTYHDTVEEAMECRSETLDDVDPDDDGTGAAPPLCGGGTRAQRDRPAPGDPTAVARPDGVPVRSASTTTVTLRESIPRRRSGG